MSAQTQAPPPGYFQSTVTMAYEFYDQIVRQARLEKSSWQDVWRNAVREYLDREKAVRDKAEQVKDTTGKEK